MREDVAKFGADYADNRRGLALAEASLGELVLERAGRVVDASAAAVLERVRPRP